MEIPVKITYVTPRANVLSRVLGLHLLETVQWGVLGSFCGSLVHNSPLIITVQVSTRCVPVMISEGKQELGRPYPPYCPLFCACSVPLGGALLLKVPESGVLRHFPENEQ